MSDFQTLVATSAMGGFGLITGLLARRKNRDALAWGAAGALLPFFTLLVLASRTYICPNCKQDLSNSNGRAGRCPLCGPIKTRASNDAA
jgi:hypothetical protein